ncbi:MAG: methionine adenosyltransferase [Firmicutes bacterium]|nr:methionine adenosyltransferase [Bacillota bacterium]
MKLFTSESVTEGHPDKICDQIADAILDEILSKDPQARVACEVMASTGFVIVSGEITTDCYVDIAKIARKTILDIGYSTGDLGFDGHSCSVLVSVGTQSPDIAQGVNTAYDEEEQTGAGDQGMMFGFACDETPEFMPFPIATAHKLTQKLSEVRKNGTIPYLRPDGKAQVTVNYNGDKPDKVTAVVVSTQHDPDISVNKIEDDIKKHVINAVIPQDMLAEDAKIYVNPTGRFVIGGPVGDCGLTGRKIIVDTYGGYAAHGGGSFSGKDPTKVDRSAAYMMRYIAKNIVAAGLANKCDVAVSYAIGVSQPVSIAVDTRGTGKIPDSEIEKLVSQHFDLRPAAIIKYFDLRRPLYKQTAAYGHFGRNDLDLPWERTDKVDVLRKH